MPTCQDVGVNHRGEADHAFVLDRGIISKGNWPPCPLISCFSKICSTAAESSGLSCCVGRPDCCDVRRGVDSGVDTGLGGGFRRSVGFAAGSDGGSMIGSDVGCGVGCGVGTSV